MKQNRWRCRLRRTFFGLSDKYIENVYEEVFVMKYYGGWSFTEAYNLPVTVRRWFLEKLINQMKKEQEAMEKSVKKSKR